MQWFLRLRANHHISTDSGIIQQWCLPQLCSNQLNVVPCRQFITRHAHRIHCAMVAGLGQAIARVLLDQPVIGFLGSTMCGIGIKPEIGIAVERLRVFQRPFGNLVFIDKNIIAVNPGRKLRQSLIVGIGRHAAIQPIVPIVHPANQVVATHETIGHQRTAMQTTPVKDRHRIIHPDNNKIDLAGYRIGRFAVFKLR